MRLAGGIEQHGRILDAVDRQLVLRLHRRTDDEHVICGTVLECDRAILGMDAVSHGKTCDEKRERARIVMKRAGRRKRGVSGPQIGGCGRTDEHTSELQSLMRTSYAVFGLQTKKNTTQDVIR